MMIVAELFFLLRSFKKDESERKNRRRGRKKDREDVI
jgi:hypothetical protein